MKTSSLGMKLGCALSAWGPVAAFLPSSYVSSPALRTRVSQAARNMEKSRCEPISTRASTPLVWKAVNTPMVCWSARTVRHARQHRLFMSSNQGQGLNQESFTERAWDAVVKLPALADANQAQVTATGFMFCM